MRETRVSVDDLVWPLFVIDGVDARQPIASLPGVERISVDLVVEAAREAQDIGIPAIALFPYTDQSLRSDDAVEALNSQNLVCRATRAVKDAGLNIGVILDVALDPYTSHGHDGLLRDGKIDNDDTVELLAKQAIVQADAGADILAPSDMMDGRIGAIRSALEDNGHKETQILSYAAKYASAFYGPFRDAVGSGEVLQGDKNTYQMDPANAAEAVREVALDIEEGADMVMVKPGSAYLDIIQTLSIQFHVPVLAYHTSGEYAMIEAAGANGWINRDAAMMEKMIAMKRAGAAAIFTYDALRMAKRLRSDWPA